MNHKNLCNFIVGPIFIAVLSAVIVLISAWIFSPVDVGRLNVLQLSVSFVLLFSMLGLDFSYIREYHESDDKLALFLNCFYPGFLLLLVLGFLSSFFSSKISSLLYADDNPYLYIITLFIVLFSYASRFLLLILRMEERGFDYFIGQLFSKIVQLLIYIFVFFFSIQPNFIHLQLFVLVSVISVVVINAINIDYVLNIIFFKHVNLSSLKNLLAYGIPFVFSGLAYWGLTAVNVILLRLTSTFEDLAIYSVANSFSSIAMLFQSIFSLVWAPMVYKRVSQGSEMKFLEDVLRQVLAVVCALVSLCGSLSWLVAWILPDGYSQVRSIFLCILVPPLLYTVSEITCIGINIQRRTVFFLWITLFALFINIFFGYILATYFGVEGVVVSNAVAFFVFFIGRTEVSARIWRNIKRSKLYAYIIILLVLVVMTVFCSNCEPFFVHIAWFFLLVFFIYMFRIEWTEIMALLSSVWKKS